MKTTNSRTSIVAAMLTVAALAPTGVAQDEQQRQFSFQFRTGDETVDVKVRGDDVDVLRNGEAADASRYRRQGKSVLWLDAKGRTRATVTFHPWGGNVSVLPESRGRVSLGVNLNRLSDALAEHLDVHADDVLYVAEAVEAKAAAKAGVRKHDVITQIDGRAPVNQTVLRQVLRDKKAGDVLELEIRRGGEARTISVELEAEDSPYGWFTNYTTPEGFDGLLQSYGTTQENYFDALRWQKGAELFTDPRTYRYQWATPGSTQIFGEFHKKEGEAEASPDSRVKDIDERLERLEELLKSLTEARKKNG